MTSLQLILAAAASMFAVALLGVLAWLVYTAWLGRLERRLEARKGVYRELVSGLAVRERALLEPELHQARTLRDFEALEAVLEEQARSVTERPPWLLDAYDKLGLVDKYVAKLREAKKWRERAFAAELLGRVWNAKAVPILLETVESTRTEDADVREIALRALARIGDPRAVAPLVEALRHAEVWLAPRIADILVRHGPLSVDAMIAFLGESTRHPARAWAANVLGEVKAIRAFPVLVRVLGDLTTRSGPRPPGRWADWATAAPSPTCSNTCSATRLPSSAPALRAPWASSARPTSSTTWCAHSATPPGGSGCGASRPSNRSAPGPRPRSSSP